MMSEDVERLERWYIERVRPFLAEHLHDKVAGLDEALARIKTLDRNVTDELAICFLGASGVGKSTLINALVAGQEQILPSGGIGPLTALAMEVRYGNVPTFEAEYHTAGNLWQGIVFPLERGHAAALKAATGREADPRLCPRISWVTCRTWSESSVPLSPKIQRRKNAWRCSESKRSFWSKATRMRTQICRTLWICYESGRNEAGLGNGNIARG